PSAPIRRRKRGRNADVEQTPVVIFLVVVFPEDRAVSATTPVNASKLPQKSWANTMPALVALRPGCPRLAGVMLAPALVRLLVLALALGFSLALARAHSLAGH